MGRHRNQLSPLFAPRHPVATWLVLSAMFGVSSAANLYLAVIGRQIWPFVVGFCLVTVTALCLLMAWRERG